MLITGSLILNRRFMSDLSQTMLLWCAALSIAALGLCQADAQELKDTRPHMWSIGIVEGPAPFSMRELPGSPNPRLTAKDPHSRHPRFWPTGNAWRFNGMHHVAPLRLDDGRWIAAIDGNGIPEPDKAN